MTGINAMSLYMRSSLPRISRGCFFFYRTWATYLYTEDARALQMTRIFQPRIELRRDDSGFCFVNYSERLS